MIRLKSIINLVKSRFCMEGQRTIESKGNLIEGNINLGQGFKQSAKPAVIEERLQLFNNFKKRMDQAYEKAVKAQILIKLKDGKEHKGTAFVTTPLNIAKLISNNLAQNAVVARVHYTKKLDFPFGTGCVSAEVEDHGQADDGELVDLTRPLEGDCTLQILTFNDQKGKEVFWHSSSHLLGSALEQLFGAWLTHGPPLDNGFFYDSFIGTYGVTRDDYEKIEASIRKVVLAKQPYERIVMTKDEALQLFKDNPFKVALIKAKVPQGSYTSAYRVGKLIDLCTGPHLSNSEKVKGFKVTKNSASKWLGNNQNSTLQRVYAISFPKQKELDQYVAKQKQLQKRDHRNVGPQQGLFNWSPLSPGCGFFYPAGAQLYNNLMNLMRSEYRIRGFKEIITPNLYSDQLWKISGHFFKYKDNMYTIEQDGENFGLKPMNCPGHCLMFDMGQHSYRDLPIRYADFGVLHRNEVSGALSGLTRVRRFQQDDAHIFCLPEQIEAQIVDNLELLDYVYGLFKFNYRLQLSTRPEKYLGDIEVWNEAQSQLKNALGKFGKEYKVNQGDGAFYGPKIDVKLLDVFGREHQCGTVQLDFQLPQRFNLQYRIKQEKKVDQPTEVQQSKEVDAADKQDKKQKKDKKNKEQGKKHVQSNQKGDGTQGKQHQSEQASKGQHENKDKKAKKQKKAKNQDKVEVKEGEEQHSQAHNKKQQKKELTMEQMEKKYAQIKDVKNGFARPVMIHRAILGSVERMMAILCEHTGGKWPFWVSPRQLVLIPMSVEAKDRVEQISNRLILEGYNVVIDNSGDSFNKKIKNAQQNNYNYIGVVGKDQISSCTIDIRDRDKNQSIGKFDLATLIKLFKSLDPEPSKRRQQLENDAFKI